MRQANESSGALLLVTGVFQIGGGIATANRLIVNALHDGGYSLTILALNEDTIPVEVHESLPLVREYVAYGGDKVRFTVAAWRRILFARPNIVFCDHVNIASMLAPLALARIARYHVRLNGIEVFPPAPDFQGRLGLRHAQVRLAISSHTADVVRRQFPRLDIDVCDLALPPAIQSINGFEEKQDRIQLKSVNGNLVEMRGRMILSVGRMESNERYKGQDKLIQAMPRILTRFADAQLVLAGKGDDSERLRQLTLEMPMEIQTAVFMPGFVPQDLLEALYQCCYLFAMPSKGEGFGLVYIEAMRWGKPCIGSNADAASGIIDHGTTGVLVDNPDDINSLADAVIGIMESPALALTMGEAGRRKVHDQYLYPRFRDRCLRTFGL